MLRIYDIVVKCNSTQLGTEIFFPHSEATSCARLVSCDYIFCIYLTERARRANTSELNVEFSYFPQL